MIPTDVEDVKFVINFDYPNNSEDYIHRIGRTARSQKTGTAYTFFTPNNFKQAHDLVSVLREANQAVNPKLIQMAEDRGGNPLAEMQELWLICGHFFLISFKSFSSNGLRELFQSFKEFCTCTYMFLVSDCVNFDLTIFLVL